MKIKLAIWVFDNIPLPSFLQPWLFGLIIGRVPHRIEEDEDGT